MVERIEQIDFLTKLIAENDSEPELRKKWQDKLETLLYDTTDETYEEDDFTC